MILALFSILNPYLKKVFMRKLQFVIPILAILAGCQVAKPEEYKSPQGTIYVIRRQPDFKTDNLPQNSDLKMVDGDLAKYASSVCILDVPASSAPIRCDLYVQADKSGTLIGYAALVQDALGVSIHTATTLNEQKEPGGTECSLDGKIYDQKANYSKPVTDASGDFDGQTMYSAWQKEPGNYVVSEVDPNDQPDLGPDTALGVWYESKKAGKLRISQERWNYCYSDSSVNVDDVFYLAVSLLKVDKAD